MNKEERLYSQFSQERLSRAYKTEKPKLMARIRGAGRSLEEAEDLIHDVYTETWGRLDRLANIPGESIDTLKARKRYVVKNLSRTLKHWIGD